MSIEQDIKQEQFKNDYQKAAINILFTASWLHHIDIARFRPHGITAEQYNVLRILRGSHPTPLMLSEITARMIDKSSNCTRLVEKLRQKGFVKREICADNRRQVDISITDKGLAILKKIDSNETEWLDSLKTITRTEARELNRILDKLRS
jgi:DNA-binding MarR family transcriptional regulator